MKTKTNKPPSNVLKIDGNKGHGTTNNPTNVKDPDVDQILTDQSET